MWNKKHKCKHLVLQSDVWSQKWFTKIVVSVPSSHDEHQMLLLLLLQNGGQTGPKSTAIFNTNIQVCLGGERGSVKSTFVNLLDIELGNLSVCPLNVSAYKCNKCNSNVWNTGGKEQLSRFRDGYYLEAATKMLPQYSHRKAYHTFSLQYQMIELRF